MQTWNAFEMWRKDQRANVFQTKENSCFTFQQKSKISIEKIVGCASWKTIYIYTQDYVIRCSCRKSLSVRDKKELIFHKRSTISIQLNVWPHSLAHNNNTHTCIHMAFWAPSQAPNTYKSDAFRQWKKLLSSQCISQ